MLFYALLWAGAGRYIAMALRGYLWGAGTAVGFGLCQYLFWTYAYPDPPVDVWGLGVRWTSYLTLYDDRVHGTLNPLTYAEALLPALLCYTVVFLEQTRTDASPLRWDRVARWFAIVIAAGTTLLLNQERGPWIGAFAGIVVILCLHHRRKFIALPLLVLLPVLVLNPGVRARLATATQVVSGLDSEDSMSVRLTFWRRGMFIIRNNLLHGIGHGQIGKVSQQYESRCADFPPNPHFIKSDLHNLFLQETAEKGLPGLAAILFLLGTLVRSAWIAYRRSFHQRSMSDIYPVNVSLAFLAFFIAFPVFNVTERAFNDAEVMLIFWLIAAVTVKMGEAK